MSCCNAYTTYYTYGSCNPCGYYRNDCCPPQQCNNICYTQCQPTSCPPTCGPCAVSYDTISSTSTSLPNNPTPTVVQVGSTSYAGVVTPITGFTATPIVNIGGITYNNTTGQFTISSAGNYLISTNAGFAINSTSGTRELYIYKIDGITGVISLLASDSRNATSVGATYITLTTNAYLNVGDRIFVGANQSSGITLPTVSNNRLSIIKLC